jgi:hypothetical protein
LTIKDLINYQEKYEKDDIEITVRDLSRGVRGRQHKLEKNEKSRKIEKK